MMAKCAADPGQVLHFRVDPECPAPTRQNATVAPEEHNSASLLHLFAESVGTHFFFKGTVGRNFLFCEKVWHCTLKCCNSQMHSAFMILCMMTVKII